MKEKAYNLTRELIELSSLKSGDLLVVGCSTSEVVGEKIGTASVPEVAEEIFSGIHKACMESDVYLAAQCCEHLNRALILEKDIANKRNYEIVSVVPHPKAGGSFATAAFKSFNKPVAVEYIQADAGMDIGDTLIGMHLKSVAVPVRLTGPTLGSARVICAKTRPKYIGGERAKYD